MTHPLTDEIIEQNFTPECGYVESDSILGVSEVNHGFNSDDLRAAADWQFERDAEYWTIVLNRMRILHPRAADSLIEEFKKAMRPQEES